MNAPPTGPAPAHTVYQLLTPFPTGTSAIAAIGLWGDIDAVFHTLGIAPVAVGDVKLRSLAGVDTGLVARWNPAHATLMPHAGIAVVRALIRALEHAGIPRAATVDHRSRFPEAATLLEAHMLDALARAASPLAIDLLLAQPRRWAAADLDPAFTWTPHDTARSTRLNHLVNPPLVVALGGPNIGKSTLLNTLAQRQVALVADQPGTTRDHVGALINFAGLVVRFVDAPGMTQSRSGLSEIDAAATRIAIEVARGADLILRCCDGGTEPLDLPALLGPTWKGQSLTVALRSDRGPPPLSPADVALSSQTGTGLEHFVATVCETLVPLQDRESPRPWRFFDAEGP